MSLRIQVKPDDSVAVDNLDGGGGLDVVYVGEFDKSDPVELRDYLGSGDGIVFGTSQGEDNGYAVPFYGGQLSPGQISITGLAALTKVSTTLTTIYSDPPFTVFVYRGPVTPK